MDLAIYPCIFTLTLFFNLTRQRRKTANIALPNNNINIFSIPCCCILDIEKLKTKIPSHNGINSAKAPRNVISTTNNPFCKTLP